MERYKLVFSVIMTLISSSLFADPGPSVGFSQKVTTDNIIAPGYFANFDHGDFNQGSDYRDNVVLPLGLRSFPSIPTVLSLVDDDVLGDLQNWTSELANTYFTPNLFIENRLDISPEAITSPRIALEAQLDENPMVDLVISGLDGILVLKNFDGKNIDLRDGKIDYYKPGVTIDSPAIAIADCSTGYEISWVQLLDIDDDLKTDMVVSANHSDPFCHNTIGYFKGLGNGDFEKSFRFAYNTQIDGQRITNFVDAGAGSPYELVAVSSNSDFQKVSQIHFLKKNLVDGNVSFVSDGDLTQNLNFCGLTTQIIRAEITEQTQNEYLVTCTAPQFIPSLVSGPIEIDPKITPGSIFVFHETQKVQVIANAGTPYGIASADFNGNGSNDLAYASMYHSALVVLRNLGDGTFEDFEFANPMSTESSPKWVKVFDYNDDGVLDIGVSTDSYQTTRDGQYRVSTQATLSFANEARFIPNAIQGSDLTIQQLNSINSVLPNTVERVFTDRAGAGVFTSVNEMNSLSTGIAISSPNLGSFRVFLTDNKLIKDEILAPTFSANSIACDALGDNFTIQIQAHSAYAGETARIENVQVSPEITEFQFSADKSSVSIPVANTQVDYQVAFEIHSDKAGVYQESLNYSFKSSCPNEEAIPSTTVLNCPSDIAQYEVLEGDTVKVCAPEEFAGKSIVWKQLDNLDFKYFDSETNVNLDASNCTLLKAPVFSWNVDFTELDTEMSYSVQGTDQTLTCQFNVHQQLLLYQGGSTGRCTLNPSQKMTRSAVLFFFILGSVIFLSVKKSRLRKK